MAWMATSTDMAAVVLVLDKLRAPPARPVIAKTQISPRWVENDVRVRAKCAECVVVESTRKIEQLGGTIDPAAGGGATWRGRKEMPVQSPKGYEVTVRMRNGSRRVFTDVHSANWRAGGARPTPTCTAGKDRIAAEYKSAKANCASLAGNASDICVAEAKGNEKITRAELEASYKPTRKTRYEARVAEAEAHYAVAKEKCDAYAGGAKGHCMEQAKVRFGKS